MHTRSLASCAFLMTVTAVASAHATPKDTCGAGQRRGLHGCVSASPQARLRESSAPPRTDPSKPGAPDVGMRPPPEHTAAEAASRQLLLAELQRLESLLKVTPKKSPERAVIVRRLAEGYAELERLAEHDRVAADLRLQRAARDAELEKKAAPPRPKTPTVL
jgi:hypothetical protein